MIILLFYVIPYMAVSAIVMVITVKYAKKIWIRGIVAVVLFLIPHLRHHHYEYSWSILLCYRSKGLYKRNGRVSAEYLF